MHVTNQWHFASILEFCNLSMCFITVLCENVFLWPKKIILLRSIMGIFLEHNWHKLWASKHSIILWFWSVIFSPQVFMFHVLVTAEAETHFVTCHILWHLPSINHWSNYHSQQHRTHHRFSKWWSSYCTSNSSSSCCDHTCDHHSHCHSCGPL